MQSITDWLSRGGRQRALGVLLAAVGILMLLSAFLPRAFVGVAGLITLGLGIALSVLGTIFKENRREKPVRSLVTEPFLPRDAPLAAPRPVAVAPAPIPIVAAPVAVPALAAAMPTPVAAPVAQEPPTRRFRTARSKPSLALAHAPRPLALVVKPAKGHHLKSKEPKQ